MIYVDIKILFNLNILYMYAFIQTNKQREGNNTAFLYKDEAYLSLRIRDKTNF